MRSIPGRLRINFGLRTTGRNNPRLPLATVAQLREQGKSAEALEVFFSYFLGKLRNPQAFGLTAWDVHPGVIGISGRWNYPGRGVWINPNIEAADRLLQGFWGEVEIGPPGQVNWLHPHRTREDLNPAEPGGLPSPSLMTATAFDSLGPRRHRHRRGKVSPRLGGLSGRLGIGTELSTLESDDVSFAVNVLSVSPVTTLWFLSSIKFFRKTSPKLKRDIQEF